MGRLEVQTLANLSFQCQLRWEGGREGGREGKKERWMEGGREGGGEMEGERQRGEMEVRMWSEKMRKTAVTLSLFPTASTSHLLLLSLHLLLLFEVQFCADPADAETGSQYGTRSHSLTQRQAVSMEHGHTV